MRLLRAGVVLLWFASTLWPGGDTLKRNPQDTRRISNSSYPVYKGRCYDYRTGIVMPRNGVPKKFRDRCMRATCFRNYTMLVESCRKTTCVVPNVKYTRIYPHCCPEVICKNGNRMRYLLTNETVTSFPTRRPLRRGKKPRGRRNKKRRLKNSTDASCEPTGCGVKVTSTTELSALPAN